MHITFKLSFLNDLIVLFEKIGKSNDTKQIVLKQYVFLFVFVFYCKFGGAVSTNWYTPEDSKELACSLPWLQNMDLTDS